MLDPAGPLLIARTEAEGYTPVSAMHALDGTVRIEMGAEFELPAPAAQTAIAASGTVPPQAPPPGP